MDQVGSTGIGLSAIVKDYHRSFDFGRRKKRATSSFFENEIGERREGGGMKRYTISLQFPSYCLQEEEEEDELFPSMSVRFGGPCRSHFTDRLTATRPPSHSNFYDR